MPPPLLRRPLRAPALLLALALLLLGAAPAVHAASSSAADEADVAFELGNEAYARGSFNLALQAYFTSYRLVPNRSVLFNIARCYEALERYNEAYRYYDLLAAEAEQLEAEDLTEVRRSLERLRPLVALVRVDSSPRGAEVYVGRVDAGSRGRTPLTLALPAGGRQRLLLRKEGYRPAELVVSPARGRQQSQSVELALVTGTVELKGSPEGAEVREGSATGPLLGRVPGRLALAPGRRVLHVSAPGHASRQLTVEVPEEGSVQAEVALGPGEGPTGRVRLTASTEGARVRVDGEPRGTTPLVLTLPEGPHTLEVESNEARAVRQQVQVVREQEQALHVTLQYAPPPVYAASRAQAPVDEAPASTTVLSQEELRAFGYTTLAEALAGVRGFFLTDDRRYTTAGVRGFGAAGDVGSRVLVLWDGHPLNDVWAAQGYVGRDLAVDLDEVERIEVVRGPASALYGSGAMLGVINVVPRDTLGVGERLELTGGLGALGGARVHAATSLESAPGGGGDRSLLLAAAVSRSRGAEFTALGPGLPTVEGLDGERAASGSVRARLGSLRLHAQLNARRKEVPTAPGGTQVGAAGTEARDLRAYVEARYERPLSERLHLSLRGSYDASRHRGLWAYATGPQTDAGGADWLTGEARLGARAGAAHALTLGVETQGQLRVVQEPLAPESTEGDAARLDTPTRVVLSVYAQDAWTLHPRLTLTGDLRLDSLSDVDGVQLSPRLALVARPYATGLTKLVAGRGFRAPSAHELYFEDGGLSQLAPESLDPEAVTAFELEHTHTLSRDLRLTLGGHHQRLSDLVVLAPGAGSCGPAGGAQTACRVYGNAPGPTRIWGAEAGVHWQPGRLLLVDLGYAWVSLQDASDATKAATPRHLATARLLLPVADGSVRLATQATYQGPRGGGKGPEAGEALLLGFGVSGDYGRLRYFAGVNNLLDVDYALPAPAGSAASAIPQYRRTFVLQLTGSL